VDQSEGTLATFVDTATRLGYAFTPDGRVVSRRRPPCQTPWVFFGSLHATRCRLWHDGVFMSFGFVPSPCHECFKVVVRPRTLKELFQLQEVARTQDGVAKCGAECRRFIPALYGGYFYTRGIDEGLDRYRAVREAVSRRVSPDVPVFLKRGCSKYEIALGRSDRWRVAPEQVSVERWLSDRLSPGIFEWDMVPFRQPAVMVDLVQKRWIQWAFQNGDSTYLEFTGGRPLVAGGTSYQDNDAAVAAVRESQGTQG